ATRECTSVLKTPWTYKNITCQTTVSRASESEALDYEIQLDYGGSTHCNLQWTRFGWLTSQATVGYCGNPSPEPQNVLRRKRGIQCLEVHLHVGNLQQSSTAATHCILRATHPQPRVPHGLLQRW